MDKEVLSMRPEFETVTRRGFVAVSATGFVFAAGGVMAQTSIHTDDAGLSVGDIAIPAAGGQIPGYYARPAGNGPFPTVLVVEEISGIRDYLKDVCRRLAKLGYFAVAPELFARAGGGLGKAADMQAALQMLNATPDASQMADLDAAVAWAKTDGKADTSRLAVTGFCLGGRVVWLYAEHNPNLKAAVAWYGRVVGATDEGHPKNALDLISDLHCPLLGLYGATDASIPQDSLERMKQAAAAAGKKVELVVYPEAGHGFHSDYRPSYVKTAADDGWKRMQAWFKQNGV